MKRNSSLLLFSTIILVIISLTVANIVTNLAFHFLPLASITTYKGVVTELIALLFWWLLNKTYLKTTIDWHIKTKTRHWLFILPVAVVLVGDATLNPSFDFTFNNVSAAILLGLTVGIFEEYVFRGILVNYLYRHFRLSAFLTAILSALAFSLVHLVNALDGNLTNTVAQVLMAFSLGLFFAIIYLITNNLWLVIIAHTIIDAFDQLAFGTLSNTAGTSMITSLIYTIFFILLGIFLLHHFSVDNTFSREFISTSIKNSNSLNFSTPISNTKMTISPTKTLIAILIPPLEILLGTQLIKLVNGQLAKSIIMDLVFLIGFLAAIWMYRDVLKTDWRQFKHHWFIKLLLAIGGVVISYAILIGVRVLIRSLGLNISVGNSIDLLSIQSATVSLIASLTVLMAPFTEEIIFRHALFYQWKKRGALTWIMFIISAILFGLAHWNNFDGNVIAMMPYMVVGAWYALIYYFSKNIWQNILTHFLFDIVQFLSAVLLFVVALIQG
ncbi:CPBP family intramembrane glutamic endopeptidase [Paucilactobacillus kaifaensis]|uniref:CPBP family intramembrane glutamic endopeptidase n=1 Tax=Paucilactobacillus kaifaensis TaxID=2559921 RepID=UPI0014850E23|nr:CPBP family intramembrane glutamic endopeptidase [Paucilactobacillus kaifaensis]